MVDALSNLFSVLAGAWILWVSSTVLKLQRDTDAAHKKLRGNK